MDGLQDEIADHPAIIGVHTWLLLTTWKSRVCLGFRSTGMKTCQTLCFLKYPEAAWPIGVENPCHPDIHIVAPEVVKGQGLSNTLAFIIARP